VSIHMNRQINDGFSYSANVDLVPLLGDKDSGKAFYRRLCEVAGCSEDELLDYDLSIYNPERGMIWGGNGEYLSSPRLDDLQCVFSALLGFISADAPKSYASVLALFDCEEVGSNCIHGANSDLLAYTAKIIAEATGSTVEALSAGGFLLSADNGHAVHPNHPEYSDPTNRPIIGGGVILKYNTSKRYITDGESGAFIRLLCKKNNIPLQTFANRSDMPGGSTLGNISGSQLPLRGADIGLPQLAMHSSYETAGCADTDAMVALTRVFFSE
ncbi:MAG: M18 family aminopeptidase, partial [Clostridia bacterium]|nr:M18 family aminopeptidase [Clostridia bacterium]